jgi:hypothetical protein
LQQVRDKRRRNVAQSREAAEQQRREEVRQPSSQAVSAIWLYSRSDQLLRLRPHRRDECPFPPPVLCV